MIQEPRLTRQTFRNKTPLRPFGRLITQPQHSRYSSTMLLEKLPPINLVVQQENKAPEDGKLLSILSEIERSTTQESLFEFKINCFKVNDRDKELALSGDINNPQLRRQLSYHVCYHNDVSMKLRREEPDFTLVLRKHQVKEYLRAKMVDWMLEVFGNYKKTTTHFTYFRAVCLMDLYLKQTTKVIHDTDLHLLGVVAMFVATKIEDIYHIPLADFSSNVTHDKFGQINIKFIEAEFIETLNYEIIFPTHLNYLHHQFYQCFSLSDDTRLNNILDTATYILKMCMHDYQVTQYSPSTIAAVSLGFAVHEYFGIRLEGMNSQSCEQIHNQQMRFQDTVIAMSHCDQVIYKECFGKVQLLISNFSKKYSELRNLEKFG